MLGKKSAWKLFSKEAKVNNVEENENSEQVEEDIEEKIKRRMIVSKTGRLRENVKKRILLSQSSFEKPEVNDSDKVVENTQQQSQL